MALGNPRAQSDLAGVGGPASAAVVCTLAVNPMRGRPGPRARRDPAHRGGSPRPTEPSRRPRGPRRGEANRHRAGSGAAGPDGENRARGMVHAVVMTEPGSIRRTRLARGCRPPTGRRVWSPPSAPPPGAPRRPAGRRVHPAAPPASPPPWPADSRGPVFRSRRPRSPPACRRRPVASTPRSGVGKPVRSRLASMTSAFTHIPASHPVSPGPLAPADGHLPGGLQQRTPAGALWLRPACAGDAAGDPAQLSSIRTEGGPTGPADGRCPSGRRPRCVSSR